MNEEISLTMLHLQEEKSDLLAADCFSALSVQTLIVLELKLAELEKLPVQGLAVAFSTLIVVCYV